MNHSSGQDVQKNVGETVAEKCHPASLSKGHRLRKPREFRETYAQGQRWVGRYMVFWIRTVDKPALLLGVVASKKVGNAVARSRAKRLLREAFRLNRWNMLKKNDVVLVARRSILKAEWASIEKELLHLARRAGLLSEEGQQ